MLFRSGLLGLLTSLSLVSKVVLFVLLIFSIVSWAVILYKWRFFRDQESADQRFLRAFEKIEDPLEAFRKIDRHRTSGVASIYAEVAKCYQVVGNGAIKGRPISAPVEDADATPTQHYLERVLDHAIQEQISRNETYLPFLATTGNITPFIGLLGTVLGIIDAFREIGVQGTASISAVAPGVAEALVATAAGLFAAIPAVIAYNYFLGRVRRQASRMERFGIEWMNVLESRRPAAITRQP
ncbi:MAG TPA: MotA/TolQ/ExbB proton channel family protein [Nitrospirales bacterium]